MNQTQFRQQREKSWRRLESLTRAERRAWQTGHHLDEFTRLYREVASDLSYAQTYYPRSEVTAYLNAVVSAAHNRFYRNASVGEHPIRTFLLSGFPGLFRSLWVYIAIAFAITAGGGLFGYALTLTSPVQAYLLLPPHLASQINPAHFGEGTWNAPVMSSVIMTNNMYVSAKAFAGGALLGLGTIYALWQNGLIVGVIAALAQSAHTETRFWSLIVPHGVTELTAIFIAGGAGLLFAHRIISPGRHRRRTALLIALRQAVQLMLGVVPMLVIAGTIEGFVTPSSLGTAEKYGVGAFTLILWTLYFSIVGRRQSNRWGAVQNALRSRRSR